MTDPLLTLTTTHALIGTLTATVEQAPLEWQTISSGQLAVLPFERDGARIVPIAGLAPSVPWTSATAKRTPIERLKIVATNEADPLSIPCRKCLAPTGQRCKGVRTHRARLRDCGATVPHWGRPRTDPAIDYDCPYCGALAGFICGGGDYHAARHRAAGQEPPVNRRRAKSKCLKKDA